MNYRDGLVSSSFKMDEKGRLCFYPYGVVGSGYVLSDQKHTEIKDFLTKLYLILFFGVLISIITVGPWLLVIFLPVYITWYIIAVKKIINNLQKTETKLGVFEVYRNAAKSQNISRLIILELSCLLFIFVGISFLKDHSNFILTIGAIVFFGIGSIVIGYMILSKLRTKHIKG